MRAVPLGAQVTVIGVVTAEQGRLGTTALLAIGDPTGGIAVRVPTGIGGFPRGTLLRVSGELAAPYGQLEIRPAAEGIRALGSEPLPASVAIGPTGLDEPLEGRRLARQHPRDRCPLCFIKFFVEHCKQ